MYAYVAEKSYYMVEEEHIEQFTTISNELKKIPTYIDLCATILRPECQLFFDFYIFLSTENAFVNHERILNVPIYSFLNEIASKNKHFQQFNRFPTEFPFLKE